MYKEKDVIPLAEWYEISGQTARRAERLWALGIGPRKTYIGARVFIMLEDHREWLKLMRDPTGRAAEIADSTKTMLHERAKRAGTAPRRGRRRQMAKIIDIDQLPPDAKGRRGWLLTVEGYPHKVRVTSSQFMTYAAIKHAYLKQAVERLEPTAGPLEPLTQQEWMALSTVLLRRYARDHPVSASG